MKSHKANVQEIKEMERRLKRKPRTKHPKIRVKSYRMEFGIDGTEEDAVILIHDGVRPFITRHILEHAVATARDYDGALVAVPAKDTVKVVEEGVVRDTPPREAIWLAQTPQAFRYGVIRAAHEIADAEGFLGTDDASLVERMGNEVHIVLGDYRNIKITTPEDLVLAEAFLRQ